ncbi:MAG: carboxypeptidase-like regulatory domain-containing protein [Acidobacteriota bacterium]
MSVPHPSAADLRARSQPPGPPARTPLIAAVAALLALLCAAPWAAAEDLKTGTKVPIGGKVVDADGQPVAGVTVLLEVSRTYFSLRKMKEIRGDRLKLPTSTDRQGGFHFDWRWDQHHNTFELAVGLEVRRDARDDFEIVDRRSVTETVLAGGSRDFVLEVEDAHYLRWLRRFLDGDASAEETRIFELHGRPDRLEMAADAPGVSTWWYFSLGKAVRFRDGSVEQETAFDPVVPEG